ncbi:uncharacterized protein METZ01_LOCUS57506 [marine metagenome]|uniref:Uncharacterized protein n=1 Tax=marine metagenome TaxID=408172 RepID=A0A381SKS3_9ZZZZ
MQPWLLQIQKRAQWDMLSLFLIRSEFKSLNKMGESEVIVLMGLPQIVLKLRSPPFVKNLRILLFPESTPEQMWGIILFIQAQFLPQQKGLCTIFHLLQSV